mgnify:CR=1 FL=1
MNTLLLNLLATTDSVKPSTTWFPENASTDNNVDPLFYFIFWICAFFLVLNAGLMIYFAIRYRQRNKEGAAHGETHNTAIEVTWSVIPAIILAIIFIWGFRGFLDMANPPNIAPEHEIAVTGRKWNWDFTYSNGSVARDKALHVPAGEPMRLTLRSEDVLHSVFIPAFRVKKDVVPGRITQLWFEAIYDPEAEPDHIETVQMTTADGETHEITRNVYDFFCTEYCGQDHSRMITKVYVYQPEDYAIWLGANSVRDPSTPLVTVGEEIYTANCASCHSTDGSNTGSYPSWQNLYGYERATSAGNVMADDAYIKESIYNPGAVIVAPYGNQMSAFNTLTDREVRALIEYMKTLSDRGDTPDEPLIWGQLNDDGTLKEATPEAGGEGAEGEGEPEVEATDGE